MKRYAHALAVPALLAAAPAAAQDGAMWVGESGGMRSIIFRGGGGAPPAPMDRAAAEMARLFKALCLEGGGEPARFPEAATEAGLKANPIQVAGNKKEGPATIDLWTGEGLVVSRTDGSYAAPVAQCNATFYVATLPDRQSVTDALSAAMASPPSNLAAAVDKKGKPRKYFVPEWRAVAPGGQVVTAFVAKGNRYMPGNRVQISIWAPKKPAP
jgi:hypothetical protein